MVAHKNLFLALVYDDGFFYDGDVRLHVRLLSFILSNLQFTVVTIALEFLDRKLLRELLELRVRLRKVNAEIEPEDEQDEDEEQEHQIRRRDDTGKIGDSVEDLREDAQDEQEAGNAEPEDRVFKLHLGIAHLARDEDERKDGNDDKADTQNEAHWASPPIFLRKNCKKRIEIAMRIIYIAELHGFK